MDFRDGYDDAKGDGDDDDDEDVVINIMNNDAVFVCVSRKIITSSWEFPVTT